MALLSRDSKWLQAILFSDDVQLARLYLTDYVIQIERAAKTEAVVEAYKAGKGKLGV